MPVVKVWDSSTSSWVEVSGSSGGGGAPTDATYVVTSSNATLTNERVLTQGSYLTITDNGSSTVTVAVDATSANTASKVVARDASGNFSAGTITATLSGNASTASALSSAKTITLSGDVTGSVSTDLSTGPTITTAIGTGVIVDADISASAAIANSKLANSSITVNGTTISLGGSGTATAAAGTLTGTTLNSTVTASSLTSFGASPTVTTPALTLSTTTSNTEGRIAWDATNDYVKVGTGSAQATFVPASLSTFVVTFSKSGTLTAGTGTFRWYNDSGKTLTINTVRASVGTAPTGASLIVDVNVDGATIYSTQTNRPTIAASGNTATGGTKSTTTVTNGQYLTADIDQVGSTVAGSDLVVSTWLSYI